MSIRRRLSALTKRIEQVRDNRDSPAFFKAIPYAEYIDRADDASTSPTGAITGMVFPTSPETLEEWLALEAPTIEKLKELGRWTK